MDQALVHPYGPSIITPIWAKHYYTHMGQALLQHMGQALLQHMGQALLHPYGPSSITTYGPSISKLI
jgi:hypothetical protein